MTTGRFMTKVTIKKKNTRLRRFVESTVTRVKHNCVLCLRRQNKTKGTSRNVKRVAVRDERGKTACLQIREHKNLHGTRRVDGAKRFFVKMSRLLSSVRRRRRSAFLLAIYPNRIEIVFVFYRNKHGTRTDHRSED